MSPTPQEPGGPNQPQLWYVGKLERRRDHGALGFELVLLFHQLFTGDRKRDSETELRRLLSKRFMSEYNQHTVDFPTRKKKQGLNLPWPDQSRPQK